MLNAYGEVLPPLDLVAHPIPVVKSQASPPVPPTRSVQRQRDMSALEAFEVNVEPSSNWMDDAVCKGRTKLFFAPKAERPQARVRREAQARLLCRTCPVNEHCQVFARDNREYGFWGGESEEVRHRAGFTVAAPIGIRARGMRSVS